MVFCNDMQHERSPFEQRNGARLGNARRQFFGVRSRMKSARRAARGEGMAARRAGSGGLSRFCFVVRRVHYFRLGLGAGCRADLDFARLQQFRKLADKIDGQ